MSSNSTKPGAILLVRHGKPALSRDVRLSAMDYRRWWDEQYEPGGLRAGEIAPDHVVAYAKDCTAVFTSVRRRAIESAALVRADLAAVQDPDLIEAPLPTPPLPESIKVGPRVWGFIARFIWWFFGYHSGQESRKQAEVRADRAVGRLIEAAKGGDVIVVAHGFFNVMLGRALRKQGWERVERTGMLHWNSRRFELRR